AAAVRAMDPVSCRDCLRALPDELRAGVFSELPLQEASTALRRLPPDARQPVLERLPLEKRRPLELLLSFPEGTAGALMDPGYLALPDDLTVAEALARIKAHAGEFVFFVYVINRQQVLVGAVSLRELLMHPESKRLSLVMQAVDVRLSALTDYRTILDMPDLKLYNALPVVNDAGVFLGAVKEESVAHLENGEGEMTERDSAHSAGAALGELFRLGLFGLVHSVEPPASKPPPPPSTGKENS
ncbi:MAG: CBS domain-containing protein, partial [Verrucomicrobiota bacterium]